MSINNAIYGTSEQWFTPPIQASQDESRQIKMVNFADVGEDEELATLEKGVLYNKIKVNEMPDLSIAVGLLPLDSSYNKCNFYTFTNNTSEELIERTEKLIPFCYGFIKGNSPGNNLSFSTDDRYVYSPDIINYERSSSYDFMPIAIVPYKNIIACPVIKASDGTSVKTFNSISEYENEKDGYNKPFYSGFMLYAYTSRTNIRESNVSFDDDSSQLKCYPLQSHLIGDTEYISFSFNNTPYTALLGTGNKTISWGGYSQSPDHHQMLIGADMFTTSRSGYTWTVEYIGTPDEFIAETKRQMSMFGIPFALDVATAESGDFDSENMCIPITNNGIGTGEYTQGTGNKDNPAYSWTEQREDSGVNPINPDTNNYVDETPTSNVSLGAWRVFNSAYVLNANELSRFANYLWNGGNSENWLDQWLNGLKLMGEDPINAVIGVKYFPFDIAQYLQILSPNLTGIIIGNNLPPVAVVGLNLRDIDTQNNNIVLDLGTAKFPKYFDNFLDFEPYTTAELYIPYCKRIKITPAFFVGKTISIKLIVDLITGACVGCVYSDNILYYTVEGVIGIDIPVTGRDNAGYAQQILSSVMGGVSSAITGNIGGFIESGMSQMTRPQIETTGTTTPANSFILPQNAYLFIHSPIPQIPSTYAHTFGNACSIGGSVGNFSGFTVFSNTDLTGISATDSEKMQIESLLNTGVYL